MPAGCCGGASACVRAPLTRMQATAAQPSVWSPVTEGLLQLLSLFKQSQSADNATHRSIQQQLTSFNAVPDYNCYLVHIFNVLRNEDGPVRQMAGLVLKNNVKEHWDALDRSVQEYVRHNLLASMDDPLPYIRTTSGSCISSICSSAGLEAWPDLVPMLYQMLDSPWWWIPSGCLTFGSPVDVRFSKHILCSAQHAVFFSFLE